MRSETSFWPYMVPRDTTMGAEAQASGQRACARVRAEGGHPGLRLRDTQTVLYFFQKHLSHYGAKLLWSAFRLAARYERSVVEPWSERVASSSISVIATVY